VLPEGYPPYTNRWSSDEDWRQPGRTVWYLDGDYVLSEHEVAP
jgi:hypothetical protein